LFVGEEVPLVTGYTVNIICVKGVAVADLVLLENGLDVLLGLEIGALDVTAWRTTLLARAAYVSTLPLVYPEDLVMPILIIHV
jgi:hypothetical protein